MSKYKVSEKAPTGIPGLPNMPDSLDSYKELLYVLMEYMEDCKGILRSLFKAPDAFKKNSHVRNYEVEIDKYRDYVGKIVNRIKHQQARLRGVFLYNDKLFVPGFYVETAINSDTVGPDRDIHEGGATAISFYRDIRYHFVQVLLSADALALAAKEIAGISTLGEEGQLNEGELSKIASLAGRVSRLPFTCFIDEVGKDEPLILEHPELVVGYGPSLWKFKTLLDFEVSVQSMGDGVTRSFKFPYLGDDCAMMIQKYLIELKRRLRYIPRTNWPFLDLSEPSAPTD
jgi:hypothetical protein